MISFTSPIALFLLLLIPYFVWVGRPYRLQSGRGRWRDWASLGLRLFILLLLTFSLAGTQMVQAADDVAVIFLIDASDSMGPEQAAAAETFVREAITNMPANAQAAVILFGSNALVERPMSGLTELGPIRSVPQSLQTNISGAIRLGLALFPAGSGRRMVLLSDGIVTSGATREAGRLAAAANVQIDYVPLTPPDLITEAMLTEVRAPTRVVEGDLFNITLTVQSSHNMPGRLRVLSGGTIVYDESIELRRGQHDHVIRLRATQQEFARYQVQLVPEQDTYYQNNQLSAFTEIVGPPRVLLVGTDPAAEIEYEAGQLVEALTAVGIEVDQITPTMLPSDLPALSNYASILLVNVSARMLSTRQMEALQSYVRDLGGGVVAVGGPTSYGMGGYFQTPLAELLPVDMEIQDQERFPSVSIVIVIDRSGSMGISEGGGLSKIELAAEASVRVVELLNDMDEIAVIPVDTQPSNPIGPMPAAQREEAIARIREMSAGGGGIFMRTGLLAAEEALANSSTQVQHIIVLADGSDAEEKQEVPAILGRLTNAGVTVTMVSIGVGQDTAWLEEMAMVGNGRFHLTQDATNLPQIFTEETANVQRSYLIEEPFFPTLVSRSPILSGIQQVPALYGYVGTSPKATAQVILETHQGDPLLAAWQYGLGRSVAWTSDATGRWGLDWVRWEGFPVFWAQAVRWTVSQSRDSLVEMSVVYQNDQARLLVDARDGDGRYLNGLDMTANLVAPTGQVETVRLTQRAPGRYETSFQPQIEGAYFIRLAGEDEGSGAVIGQTGGWVLGYSPEYQQLEPDVDLLAQLAGLTGGRDITGNQTAVFDSAPQSQASSRPIWPWLTLLALLLLPLDVGLRRLVVTRRDMARLGEWLFGRFRSEPAAAPTQSEPVARLFAAKRRAGTQRDRAEGLPTTTVPTATVPTTTVPTATVPTTTVPDPPKEDEGQKRPPVRPAGPTADRPSPAAPDSLAARLLRQKQGKQQDNDL
jgi:uncharacterized membrane protein